MAHCCGCEARRTVDCTVARSVGELANTTALHVCTFAWQCSKLEMQHSNARSAAALQRLRTPLPPHRLDSHAHPPPPNSTAQTRCASTAARASQRRPWLLGPCAPAACRSPRRSRRRRPHRLRLRRGTGTVHIAQGHIQGYQQVSARISKSLPRISFSCALAPSGPHGPPSTGSHARADSVVHAGAKGVASTLATPERKKERPTPVARRALRGPLQARATEVATPGYPSG
jgi:hypothetical protein